MFASLAGRSVIVTGASKGIGRGIAKRFAEVGCRVVVVARSAEAARLVAEDIAVAGGAAIPVAADVSTEAGVAAMAAAALRHFGGIDILCANAGIFPTTRIGDISLAEFDEVMAINLRGTFLSVKACLPELTKTGRGRIVITSSITGPITGQSGFSHYGASKSGQLGFMRSAAIELAGAGITVNAILPGNIATEGLLSLGRRLHELDDRLHSHEAARRRRGYCQCRPVLRDRGSGLHHRPDPGGRWRSGAPRKSGGGGVNLSP